MFKILKTQKRKFYMQNEFSTYSMYFDNKKELTLVGVHGIMGSYQDFYKILQRNEIKSLSNGYLIELRNHGFSKKLDSLSIQEFAQDLKHTLYERNDQNIVLMGHSEGASAIMCLLNDDPEIHSRIKGCIIIERSPISYRELSQDIEKFLLIDDLRKIKLENTSIQQIQKEIEQICGRGSFFSNVAVRNIQNDPQNALNYQFKTSLQLVVENHIQLQEYIPDFKNTFANPILVLSGIKSSYVTNTQEFQKLFSQFDAKKDLVYIKNAGHWPHLEQEDQFVSLVQNYLQKL